MLISEDLPSTAVDLHKAGKCCRVISKSSDASLEFHKLSEVFLIWCFGFFLKKSAPSQHEDTWLMLGGVERTLEWG